MLCIFLLIVSGIFTLAILSNKKRWDRPFVLEVFLGCVLVINVGLMDLILMYLQVFRSTETALLMGWMPGSPFQFAIGMAHLSYGALGILCFWYRGRFWDAVCIGRSILAFGFFADHISDYYINGNDAPFNLGVYVWFNDFVLPIILLSLLFFLNNERKKAHAHKHNKI